MTQSDSLFCDVGSICEESTSHNLIQKTLHYFFEKPLNIFIENSIFNTFTKLVGY